MTRAGKKTQNSRKDALTTAMKLLSIRQHSVKELTAKLSSSRRCFSREDVEKAISTLSVAGYLDDSGYAIAMAATRACNKHWGPAKISAELTAKGVARDIVKKAVAEQFGTPGASEAEAAGAAFEKWLIKNGLTAPLDKNRRVKAVRFLTGRGFSISVAIVAAGGGYAPPHSGYDDE